MKKLTLFLTLSLLTLIGTSTLVKAEENQPADPNADPNAVVIDNDSDISEVDSLDQGEAAQPEVIEEETAATDETTEETTKETAATDETAEETAE